MSPVARWVPVLWIGRRGIATSKPKLSASIPAVQTVISSLHDYSVTDFREQAFLPELPLLIAHSTESSCGDSVAPALPAIQRWFHRKPSQYTDGGFKSLLNRENLSQYGSTMVPYEIIVPAKSSIEKHKHFRRFIENVQGAFKANADHGLIQSLGLAGDEMCDDKSERFHSFHAPLELFLKAVEIENRESPASQGHGLHQLYIAQAQLQDLAPEMAADLPTPHLVLEAGKGDVYDANLWMGTPSTYTPLHKDPNPNLFVQLCSSKVVRLCRPDIGRAIFYDVQRALGANGNASMRGEEMMMGAERALLEQAVWENAEAREMFEVTVRPGDGLFIPKGWWHSIKSIGEDVNASVNWWFR